jgi:tetratricopeptide (TPR) repeat protein
VNAPVLVLVWLLQPAAAQGALGTARPPECAASARFGWERAKEPNLRRYCELLASGTTKLVEPVSMALVEQVPAIADEADRLMPGRASASVLKGRALLRLGHAEEALAALREAKRRDERALDDPVALLAWARANARTDRLADAVRAYRAALPRASALPPSARAAASFEAGIAVMAQGPEGIDDAVAMLRQARRDAQDAMQVASLAALALALDRAGQRDEAAAVLAERSHADVKAFLGDARVTDALLDAGARHEADALLAIALEASGAQGARDAWRAYVAGAGGKGPWAAHARDRAGGAPAARRATPRRTGLP